LQLRLARRSYEPEYHQKALPDRPKALAELAAVGWKLDEYAKGKWEIGRPASITVIPPVSAPTPCLTVPNPLFNGARPFLKTQQRRALRAVRKFHLRFSKNLQHAR
jgi:hypothetical protein